MVQIETGSSSALHMKRVLSLRTSDRISSCQVATTGGKATGVLRHPMPVQEGKVEALKVGGEE